MMRPMARNLDLDLLRTFVAAADLASMTAAARALHRTQGAVSQQVKRLEAALGLPLFARDRRGLRLTRAGEQLLPRARRLVGLNDDIWSEMTADAVRGKVRVGVPHDLIDPFMGPILRSYAQAHPEVEISLECASSPDLLAALAGGEADLVLAEEPVATATGESLRVERLVWVGARGGRAHLRSPLPVSMVADTCAFRPVVLSALARQGRAWRTVFEGGGIEATAATVRTDLAVTAWLACAVPSGLDVLASGSGLPDLPSFAVALHVPKGRMTAAAQAMTRHVRDGLRGPSQAS